MNDCTEGGPSDTNLRMIGIIVVAVLFNHHYLRLWMFCNSYLVKLCWYWLLHKLIDWGCILGHWNIDQDTFCLLPESINLRFWDHLFYSSSQEAKLAEMMKDVHLIRKELPSTLKVDVLLISAKTSWETTRWKATLKIFFWGRLLSSV